MHIYIIRHSETDANNKGLFQGWSNYDLNDNGIEIAVRTGRAMQGIIFDAAFASPLIRTEHTARIVLDESGNPDVDIVIDERIKEVNMGDWELKHYRGEPDVDEEQLELYIHDSFSFGGFPNGETIQNLCDRTQEFLNEIAHCDYNNVLITTHACVVRGMLNFLYEDSSDFWHGGGPKNCSVNLVEVSDGQLTLIEDDKVYCE